MRLSASTKQTAWGVAFWAGALGAWEAAYRIIGWKPWVFPSPSHIAESALLLLGEPSHHALVTALVVSGGRLVAGFALSIALGLMLGIALWRWRFRTRAIVST